MPKPANAPNSCLSCSARFAKAGLRSACPRQRPLRDCAKAGLRSACPRQPSCRGGDRRRRSSPVVAASTEPVPTIVAGCFWEGRVGFGPGQSARRSRVWRLLDRGRVGAMRAGGALLIRPPARPGLRRRANAARGQAAPAPRTQRVGVEAGTIAVRRKYQRARARARGRIVSFATPRNFLASPSTHTPAQKLTSSCQLPRRTRRASHCEPPPRPAASGRQLRTPPPATRPGARWPACCRASAPWCPGGPRGRS